MSKDLVKNIPSIEFKILQKPVDYVKFLLKMNTVVKNILSKRIKDSKGNIKAPSPKAIIYILQHKSIYTAGTSFCESHILDPKIKVFQSSFGGGVTYQGLGQIIIYPIIDLLEVKNIRRYIMYLQKSIIDALKFFGVFAVADLKTVGVYVQKKKLLTQYKKSQEEIQPNAEANIETNTQANTQEDFLQNYLKIASIGVRLNNWVTYHGASINVDVCMSNFAKINPCGLSPSQMTSLLSQGNNINKAHLIQQLKKTLQEKLPFLFM